MSLTYYTMCQQESQVKDMNVSRYSRKNKKAVADSPTFPHDSFLILYKDIISPVPAHPLPVSAHP